MAKINIIVPRLDAHRFSGGIWCILEYAHGLSARGHDVTVVPISPSPYPQWFTKTIGQVIVRPKGPSMISSLRDTFAKTQTPLSAKVKSVLRIVCTRISEMHPGLFEHPIRMGIAEIYIRGNAPPADIVIATSFETARPASMLSGKKFYFGQHFEPYFSDAYPDPQYAEALARESYRLDMHLIANSSWLQNLLKKEVSRTNVSLCCNAIDHSVFWGKVKSNISPGAFVLISYGGRDAEWKGFREMAQAVAIARKQLRHITLEWKVYGSASVGPEEITPYVPLGFLNPAQLSEEYRKADALLSASWYESFPLFPIEAMACGLAVITTQLGTEDYAISGETAEIVEPRNVENIAKGIVRLATDREYRLRIASAGQMKAKMFTWNRAVAQLEQIITTIS